MTRLLPLGTVFLLLIGAGLWAAGLTDRWALSGEPDKSAKRLSDVPIQIGAWSAVDRPINQRELSLAGATGSLARTYENGHSQLSVVLLCGRPGPISVHTPDICYRGVGYDMAGSPKRFKPSPDSPTEFWTADFVKRDPLAPSSLRIFWAWNATGPWQAPDNPRWEYARHRALYKFYIIRELASAHEPLEKDPCVVFLKEALPALDQALFAAR